MRSLLFAICAAAVFAIWASGARAQHQDFGLVKSIGGSSVATFVGRSG